MARVLRLTEDRDSFPDADGREITSQEFHAYIEKRTKHGIQIFPHDDRKASIEEFHSFLESGSVLEAIEDRYLENAAKAYADIWDSALEYFFDGVGVETLESIEREWGDSAYELFLETLAEGGVVLDEYVPFSYPIVFLVPDTAFISPDDKELYNFETLRLQLGERGFKSPSGKISPSFRGADWSEKHVDSFVRYVLDNGLSVSVTPIVHAFSVYRFYQNSTPEQPVKIKGNPRIFYCYDRERGLGKILVSPKARIFGDFTPNASGVVPSVTKKDLPSLLDYGPSSLGSIVRTHLWKW